MSKNILTSLGPNYEKDDVMLALQLIASPEKYNDNLANERLEKMFASLFGNKYKSISINSGRSALFLILKSLGIRSGDEVLLQSFTCVAVPNSILWNGAKPVYVDISKNLNIDPNDLKKKITGKSKAVIVQHTLGMPADVTSIKEICKKNDLFLIEDCAHSLGATYYNAPVGSFGDISFFSFGRDKTISSVFGGMILTKNEKLYKKTKKLRDQLSHPGYFWTFQQLLHPILMSIIKPTYNKGLGKFSIGKVILYISQKLKLLSFPVYEKEKIGEKPDIFPKKMPGVLSILALNQLSKLSRFVEHRRKISKLYRKELGNSKFKSLSEVKGESLLRFPVFVKDPQEIYKKFKKNGILLGDWYNCPVVPCVSEKNVGYKKGECLKAEAVSREILNLPTYIDISEDDAKLIVSELLE